MNYRFLTGSAAVALLVGLAAATSARADDAPPAHPMLGIVQFSGDVSVGSTFNPGSPKNNVNYGQIFNDRANSFGMNQAQVTAEKDLDPAATGMDWGFKFEPMYGTDARVTHSFTVFDHATNSPYQWDIVEANGSFHLPIVVSGGIDTKIGTYSTPIGYEVINATGNFFATHSYIFNYGIPLKHTGLISTAHVTDMVDIWAGVDTGVNGWLPTRGGDNNKSPSVMLGFGLNNLLDGNLTVLALAHIGPENGYIEGQRYTAGSGTAGSYTNGAGQLQNPNKHAREIYDIVTSYKIGDAITTALELNVIHDDLGVTNTASPLTNHSGATAEGAAVYGTFKLNDMFTFGAREEVFRDDQGFFVSTQMGSQSYVNASRGIPSAVGMLANGKATYNSLTLGANITPPFTLPYSLGLLLRPEARWDHAFGTAGNNKVFNSSATATGTSNDQFLLSLNAVVSF